MSFYCFEYPSPLLSTVSLYNKCPEYPMLSPGVEIEHLLIHDLPGFLLNRHNFTIVRMYNLTRSWVVIKFRKQFVNFVFVFEVLFIESRTTGLFSSARIQTINNNFLQCLLKTPNFIRIRYIVFSWFSHTYETMQRNLSQLVSQVSKYNFELTVLTMFLVHFGGLN